LFKTSNGRTKISKQKDLGVRPTRPQSSRPSKDLGGEYKFNFLPDHPQMGARHPQRSPTPRGGERD
jgi:hypothetical protein